MGFVENKNALGKNLFEKIQFTHANLQTRIWN